MKTKVYKLNFYRKAEDIFECYKEENMAIFLDSSLENQLGQYSVIGLNPYLILKEEDGIFYENGKPQKGTLETALKGYLGKIPGGKFHTSAAGFRGIGVFFL